MTSFDYRLNPIYAIKECSSCGSLYTSNCGCSKGSLGDKILVPIPDSSQRSFKIENFCLNCGDPIHGFHCQGCALIQKTFEEVLQDFQDTSKSSDDNTNVVNAPREPIVVNQDPGENSSPSPPHIDYCCHECGDSLDGIFCRQCTCKSCGKGAHYGYNCPPKVPIISNPEPCKNQTIDEPLQNLQSLQQQCLFRTCQQCGCNEYDGVCFYCKVGNGTPFMFQLRTLLRFPQVLQTISTTTIAYHTLVSYVRVRFSLQLSLSTLKSRYVYNQSFSFSMFTPEYTVNHPIFNSQNELLNSQNKLMEQMATLRDLVDQVIQKKEEEKRIAEEQAAKDRSWKIPICYDDDEDNTIAITPVLPIEEPDNSLSMGDEHLDTIPETESDEVIKSSVEDLVPIPSESEGIPDKMCDVPLCENTTPLEAFKEHSETIIDYNDDSTSSDDDSYENIDYVDASPPDVEIVSLEVVEIVDPEVGRIDDDILLTIKDDILREKLLNVNLLIAKIDFI
ncbi:hypothetical protein Tco_0922190 [Tanacetum coccineum]|uniref:CCHC-type domain-containing protein n=1 Tax=Tanacetum coccineum TaxID=301880 RepID=A0ABQ5D0P1_9ASTR